MKKLLTAFAFVCFIGMSEAGAQEKVKEGAKKVGNKTAEVASKGKSKVANTKVKDKIGPNGETIYVDKNQRYYWIDKRGRKHYLTAAQLKDKPNDQD